MMSKPITKLGLIAGKGAYPLELAACARAGGVARVVAVAFKGETSRALVGLVDEVRWLYVGQLQRMLDALQEMGVSDVVMAGQITPSNLFRVRPDKPMLDLLRALPRKNADTIFGALGDRLADKNITLHPAHLFMEPAMPGVEQLAGPELTEIQQADVAFGQQIAHETSRLEIGQTVIVKEGTVLAVEAFEGTDAAIRRAGRLGGPGAVVVKVARRGHDMRFDIPVVGLHTLKSMSKAKAAVLAVEAGRAILLEREKLIADAVRRNLRLTSIRSLAEDKTTEVS